jgi:acyl-CoA thioesterase FadM
MLGYTLRVGTLLLRHSVLGPRAVPSEPFVVSLRAWPWHCDAYRHLNNAVYLRLAEDARWAWTARTPLLKQALKSKWVFLVGGADVVYRRSVPLMSRLELISRVVGVDERWLYFSQEFLLPSGKSACRILIRAMVRSPTGPIDPLEVLRVVDIEPPPPSNEVRQLQALSESQLSVMSS